MPPSFLHALWQGKNEIAYTVSLILHSRPAGEAGYVN